MLLRDKSRSESKVRVWMWMIFLVLLFASVSGAYIAQSAAGLPNSPNWFNEDDSLQADSTKDVTWDELWREEHNCRQNDITVVEHGTGRSTLTQGCVVDGVSARIALNVAGSRYHHISIGLDEKFYPIINVNANTMTLRFFSNSDRFLMIGHALGEVLTGTFMAMYDDIGSRLHYVDGGAYSLDTTNSLIFPGTDQAKLFVKGYGFSPDGTYLVYGREHQESYAGDRITKVNLETGEHKIIGIGYKAVWWNPGRAEYGISDNGDYVVSNNFIWDTRDCGVNIVDDSYALENPCAKRRPYACARLDDCSPRYVRFEGMYKFKVIVGNSNLQEATYVADNYGSGGLDYLALGDSFSSGEGDIERDPQGRKYYRYTTNVDGSRTTPRDKCHISTRSYPYLLARGMDLALDSPKQWDTVACSGAVIKDVKSRLDTEYYQGQPLGANGVGRLDGFSNASQLKVDALNEFIPGREKQIEFVRKYKPKVITLTMGGNDIGFGKKIESCAHPGTCEHALSRGKERLAGEISDQYDNLNSLYANLYEASDRQAKIYVIGYPQFISREGMSSCSGIASLNYDERQMIYYSVEYMNNVIKAAASAAGVKYIDIEDSLAGHKLCDDGTRYVTGVVGIPISIKNEPQESFHPNAKGHFEIAMTVWDGVNNESLLDFDICPHTVENICPNPNATKQSVTVPDYFHGSIDNKTKISIYQRFTSYIAKKGSPVRIMTNPYMFRPSSAINVTIYSDPMHLGNYIAASDGSFVQDVVIPDSLPAGYHTIILTGETYSGESVEAEQVVLVHGADPDDIDENGILDSKQPCGPFMPLDEDKANLDAPCNNDVGEGKKGGDRNNAGNVSNNLRNKNLSDKHGNQLKIGTSVSRGESSQGRGSIGVQRDGRGYEASRQMQAESIDVSGGRNIALRIILSAGGSLIIIIIITWRIVLLKNKRKTGG